MPLSTWQWDSQHNAQLYTAPLRRVADRRSLNRVGRELEEIRPSRPFGPFKFDSDTIYCTRLKTCTRTFFFLHVDA